MASAINQFSRWSGDKTLVFLREIYVVHLISHCIFEDIWLSLFKNGTKVIFFLPRIHAAWSEAMILHSCCVHDLYPRLIIQSEPLHFDSKSIRALWISSLEVEWCCAPQIVLLCYCDCLVADQTFGLWTQFTKTYFTVDSMPPHRLPLHLLNVDNKI